MNALLELDCRLSVSRNLTRPSRQSMCVRQIDDDRVVHLTLLREDDWRRSTVFGARIIRAFYHGINQNGRSSALCVAARVVGSRIFRVEQSRNPTLPAQTRQALEATEVEPLDMSVAGVLAAACCAHRPGGF